MLIRLLPLLFMLPVLNGFAQEPITPASASKFRIGVNGSIDLAYRRVSAHYAIADAAMEAWNIKHTEGPGRSYGGNIRLGYAIAKRTDLEVGVGYLSRRFSWDYNKMRFPWTPYPIGAIDPDRRPAPRYRQLQYLEFPMRLSHSIGQGSISWISSIGVTTGLLIYEPEPTASPYLGQPALFIWKPRRVNVAPTFSTGVAFSLTERSELRTEATAMYGITRLTESSVWTNMWSTGVNLGYYRRF
jgi:hypothetical protein